MPHMNAAVPMVFSKALNRLRRTGFRATARYCVIAAKHKLHDLFYDRSQDRLERWPTGESCLVRDDDIAGPVGSADDKSYQAAPRLVLFWAIEALRIDPADYNFID